MRRTDAEAKLGELRRGSAMQVTRAFKLILIGLLLVPGLGKQSEAHGRTKHALEAEIQKIGIPNKTNESTNPKETKKAIPEDEEIENKLIKLLAYNPHLLDSSRLEKIYAIATADSLISFKNKSALQMTALMFFSKGEHNKFSKISKTIKPTKANTNSERMLDELMESSNQYINGNFGASERSIYSATNIFLRSQFKSKIKKLAYGKILLQIMSAYIDSEWTNSLRQKLLTEALGYGNNTCEEENSVRTQLRDTLIDQIRYLESAKEQSHVLKELPEIIKECEYNKLFVSTQNSLTHALLKSLSSNGTIEGLEDLPDGVGLKILRINITKDPNAISMKALVSNNGLLLANKSYVDNYLGHLIVKNNKAREVFRNLKSLDISSVINKSFIARTAVQITSDIDNGYSKKDKDIAILLAREAFQQLIAAGKKQKDNPYLAWEITDYMIDMMFRELKNNEHEKLTDIATEYISTVKQPSIVKAVMLDTIYMSYISSESFSKAIKYGAWMQNLHIKGWRTSGLGLPNAGETITPEEIEYSARIVTHVFLLRKIVEAAKTPTRFQYEKAKSMILKDVLNLKGISIDLLKKKRIAIESGQFNLEERRILDKGLIEQSKRPFMTENLITALRHRLLEVRLIEMVSRADFYPKQIGIDEIASILEPPETLVEYIELLGEYFIITLRSDGEIFVTTAGEKQEVDSLINSLLANISDVNSEESKKIIENLAKRILSPIHDELLLSEIIYVSPDSSLHKVPFHLLIDSYKQNISNMPTARLITSGRDLLGLKIDSANISDGDPVVIANPDFNHGANHVDSYDKSKTGKWLALPGTQKEGKAIASLLNTSYVGEEEAQKEFVKSLVAPKILHIATHAFYNAEAGDSKNNSGMVFAGANVLPIEESILSPEEISLLNLNGTRLTVLSACETGIGEVLEGGSMASIQRAFTIAGTRSVINTLWKVDDYSSMAFMKALYGYLIEGKSLEQAMTLTRNYFKNHPIPGWRAPYYWAAFQLYGDWRPVF